MMEAFAAFLDAVKESKRVDLIMVAAVDTTTGWSFGEVWKKEMANVAGAREALLKVLGKYEAANVETIH